MLYTGSGMGGGAGELLWYHRNDQQPVGNLSYDWSLRHQSLDGIGLEALNPLRNRTFAGFITHHDSAGKLWSRVAVAPAAFGLTGSVSSQAPLQQLGFDLFTLTELRPPSLSAFMQRFQAAVQAVERVPLEEALRAHRDFWLEFHNRSHIAIRVTDEAVPDREAVSFNLTRDLLLQRMVDAMNGFSDYPIHFNGQVRQTGSHTGAPLSPSSAASQLCAAVRVLCWAVLLGCARATTSGRTTAHLRGRTTGRSAMGSSAQRSRAGRPSADPSAASRALTAVGVSRHHTERCFDAGMQTQAQELSR